MRCVLVSGANGGVGKELCEQFYKKNWYVIATDVGEISQSTCHEYISIDFIELNNSENYRDECIRNLKSKLPDGKLDLLINNAALQVVNTIENLTLEDWKNSFSVNVHTPFILIQSMLKELEATKGMVLNIGSIHSRLTKSSFSAYAASKTALDGLTKSLAVELGKKIRINSINPAAVATPMLKAGFENNLEALSQLENYHPGGCIGATNEVARIALYLASEESAFFNGIQFNLDGGIGSKLHDPD